MSSLPNNTIILHILHACMRILLSPSSNTTQYEQVRTWLKIWVNNFSVIYGPEHVVLIIHNVTHLVDDCIHFQASLDTISAFPFENYLGKLKSMLCGTRRPVAQLYKRLLEIEYLDSMFSLQQQSKYCDQSVESILKSFRENSPADSFCFIDGRVAIDATEVTESVIRGRPLIISKSDGSYTNFYSDPLPLYSSDLGIFLVGGRLEPIVSFRVSRSIRLQKCILFPFKSPLNEKKHLLIPLLHQV